MFKHIIFTFALCIATSSLIFGATGKLSPDLQLTNANANVRVIVQYGSASAGQTPGVVLGGGSAGAPAPPLASILNLGGLVSYLSAALNAVACTMPVSTLQTLAKDPNVTYITPDRPVSARLDYTAAAVNASSAWRANLTGAGVGVAVIDSGINPSADLAALGLLSRIVYVKDFTGGNGSDQYGHGTHVAGIVGANGMSSECLGCARSLVGMAPNASLINLRVLDVNGQGSDSSVIAAIDEAIRLKNTYNIRVINLSVGRPIYESYTLDPLCQAVEAAWKAGITVVAAAGNDGRDNSTGNDGYGTIESPGNDPYAITVGAMKAMGSYARTDDLVASYSSKGPAAIDHVVKPDIMAPGNHVVSLQAAGSTLAGETANQIPLSYYEARGGSGSSTKFLMLNGTSMATPVVSGVVADLLQAHPTLTPDQVKARLMKTAYKTFPQASSAVDPVSGESFVSQYDIFTVGAGYLDVAAALASSELATGSAMSPIATYDATSGNVSLNYDSSSTWNDSDVAAGGVVRGTKGVWGTTAVWGNTVVDANKTIWGAQAVWGESSLAGFRTVWGVEGPDGTRTTWGVSGPAAVRTVWGVDSTTSDSDTNFAVNPR